MTNSTNGATMPTRIHCLLGLLIPTAGWPWWVIWLQGVIAVVGAELLSTNLALKWLFIGCVADVFLLLARSWFLPEHYSFRILIPDILVRAISLYLSWALSKEAAFQFEYAGYSTNPGELLAIFFITVVWASAGKSSEKFGIRWPNGIMYLLNKVHSSLDDVELGDRAFSILTKFAQKTDGNKTVTSKTETVVTTVPAEEKK